MINTKNSQRIYRIKDRNILLETGDIVYPSAKAVKVIPFHSKIVYKMHKNANNSIVKLR